MNHANIYDKLLNGNDPNNVNNNPTPNNTPTKKSRDKDLDFSNFGSTPLSSKDLDFSNFGGNTTTTRSSNKRTTPMKKLATNNKTTNNNTTNNNNNNNYIPDFNNLPMVSGSNNSDDMEASFNDFGKNLRKRVVGKYTLTSKTADASYSCEIIYKALSNVLNKSRLQVALSNLNDILANDKNNDLLICIGNNTVLINQTLDMQLEYCLFVEVLLSSICRKFELPHEEQLLFTI